MKKSLVSPSTLRWVLWWISLVLLALFIHAPKPMEKMALLHFSALAQAGLLCMIMKKLDSSES